jgi:hypothetical protein
MIRRSNRSHGTILKVVLTASILVAALICWFELRAFQAWRPYIDLSNEVRSGRNVPDDLARLEPILAAPAPVSGCSLPELRSLAILSLYRADLLARGLGIAPHAYTDDLSVQIARGDALHRIRNVLVCSPLDGDMWLRLASVSRALRVAPDDVEAYLQWSYRTTPHERWIETRRAALFPDGPGD